MMKSRPQVPATALAPLTGTALKKDYWSIWPNQLIRHFGQA